MGMQVKTWTEILKKIILSQCENKEHFNFRIRNSLFCEWEPAKVFRLIYSGVIFLQLLCAMVKSYIIAILFSIFFGILLHIGLERTHFVAIFKTETFTSSFDTFSLLKDPTELPKIDYSM